MKQIIFIFLLSQFYIFSQINLEIGGKSPAIIIANWTSNSPENKKFKGKFIVLEFWATWCLLFIKYVPHLNNCSF